MINPNLFNMHSGMQPGAITTEITLRDLFAMAALGGWLSGPCQGDVLDCYEGGTKEFAEHQASVARVCFEYADAMIAEREKKR